ncbi:hypothetical protein TTHERM_00998920 (macronuclear) [Tetrahymena thermophila SB210]|uniref:Uncharacterized protein n=1 Tax=Tetrahymena thermophila (strain SB210) TaxID=312017 RepID=Q22D85_TETTS|nr:hypothetical protein TTHERM_00998920 [Tetrahymena thermophila SB210]EAR83240.2 hypothetical protein TTHERM_00998920 [Tetrahymena thermophila SB210]|eukprot:XP_001030903.2 hypothetical protein TTHERM_00998920 [Tetrahymena thermophila SB210]
MGCSHSSQELQGNKLKKEIIRVYNEISALRKLLFQVVQLPLPAECLILNDIKFICENSNLPQPDLNDLLIMYMKNIEYRIRKILELQKQISIDQNINKSQIQYLLSYYNIINQNLIQTSVSLSDLDSIDTQQEI